MRAMLDTCIVLDFPRLQSSLPSDLGISTIVLAELATGVLAVSPGPERERRNQRLQWASTFFEPHSFDALASMSYAKANAAVRRAGRSPRSRIADLMIAATAATHNVPLYTNNTDDFLGLDRLVEIIAI